MPHIVPAKMVARQFLALVAQEANLKGASATATRLIQPAYNRLNPFVYPNRVVIALGGNAMKRKGSNAADTFVPGQKVGPIEWTMAHEEYIQLSVLREVVKQIAQMIKDGKEVIITHGNGPQYGAKAAMLEELCDMPGYMLKLYERGFMTKPYIDEKLEHATAYQSGEAVYWTQDLIGNTIKYLLLEELAKLGINDQPVEMVYTSILVDTKDPSFKNPTKPVGSDWFTQEEAAKVASLYAWQMGKCATQDPNDPKCYRRMVPSPLPLQVVEGAKIKGLIKRGVAPIVCGGGGVPVIYKGGELIPIKGIIDKDRASALLARDILAGRLTIVTDADYVYTDFANLEKRAPIKSIDVVSLMKMVEEGVFEMEGFAGSMGPKLNAIEFFLGAGPGAAARITSPENLADPESGTLVHQPEGLLSFVGTEVERALVLSQGLIPDALMRRILFHRMGS